jgi:hypothetical protein
VKAQKIRGCPRGTTTKSEITSVADKRLSWPS